MDEIDVKLIEAWHRISSKCRANRTEAARRARRRLTPTLMRPPRAWCVAIRASDTRIDDWSAGIAPREAVYTHEDHTVVLDGDTIRKLIAPVHLPWPGVPLTEAARMLGKHRESLRHWLPLRPGRTREARATQAPRLWEFVRKEGAPLVVSYHPASRFGHKGDDVPVVYSDSPLDPAAWRGEPPHPIWGTMWQHFHDQFPEDHRLYVERVPRVRPYLDEIRFRGWDWMCPGRWRAAGVCAKEQRASEETEESQESDESLDEEDVRRIEVNGRWYERQPCGRRCMTLYSPLPIYGIASLIGEEEGFEIDARVGGASDSDAREGLGLAGRWYPGLHDPLQGLRSFACQWCWNIKRLSLANARGWGEFVTYISGGLLYGKEVERPACVELTRKRAYKPRPRRGKKSVGVVVLERERVG